MKEGTSTNIGGASGSFFFFTEDNKYIIKTITKSELGIFVDMVKDFKQHYITQRKKGTPSLIAMIQGLYTFKLNNQSSIHLALMNNSIQKIESQREITFLFDLKGSMVNR